MKEQLCYECKQYLGIDEFYKNRARWSGIDSRCKSCTKIRNKKNRLRLYEMTAEWRKLNPEYRKQWTEKNPEYDHNYYINKTK